MLLFLMIHEGGSQNLAPPKWGGGIMEFQTLFLWGIAKYTG